jgi:hypothetical protein
MRSLEEEPRTVPSARTWPLRINAPTLRENAPARGVSTRIFSYPKLLQRHHSPLSRGSRAETNASTYYVPAAQRRSPRLVRGLKDKYRRSTTATTIRYTSATQGIFQYNNVLGSPMFAFSRHNYYVQEKIRSTRTPEEQHASSDRGNTDVRQYLYDVYVKSAELRRFQAYHAFST